MCARSDWRSDGVEELPLQQIGQKLTPSDPTGCKFCGPVITSARCQILLEQTTNVYYQVAIGTGSSAKLEGCKRVETETTAHANLSPVKIRLSAISRLVMLCSRAIIMLSACSDGVC